MRRHVPRRQRRSRPPPTRSARMPGSRRDRRLSGPWAPLRHRRTEECGPHQGCPWPPAANGVDGRPPLSCARCEPCAVGLITRTENPVNVSTPVSFDQPASVIGTPAGNSQSRRALDSNHPSTGYCRHVMKFEAVAPRPARRKPNRDAGVPAVELAGLEPVASWVRSRRSPAQSLACLQGFRCGGGLA